MFLISIVSFDSFAHGMYPTGRIKEEYSVISTHNVHFSIRNSYDFRMCYDVSVNGSVMLQHRTCLNAKETKEKSIYVRLLPNQWARNTVCTLSSPIRAQRTQMCLESLVYYFAS